MKPRLYSLAWGFYLILALAAPIWCGFRGDEMGLALFLDVDRIAIDLGAGAAAGAGLLGCWWLMAQFVPAASRLEANLARLLGELTGAEALSLAIISGLSEEFFFRGAVQGSWGLLPATLVFAVLHTGPGKSFRLWTLFAAVAGLLFGGLVLWSGNLFPAIVAHALVNGINLRRLGRHPAALEDPDPQAETEGPSPGQL